MPTVSKLIDVQALPRSARERFREVKSSRYVRETKGERERRKKRITLIEEFFSMKTKLNRETLKEHLSEEQFQKIAKIFNIKSPEGSRVSRSSSPTLSTVNYESSLVSSTSITGSETSSCESVSEEKVVDKSKSSGKPPKLTFPAPQYSVERFQTDESLGADERKISEQGKSVRFARITKRIMSNRFTNHLKNEAKTDFLKVAQEFCDWLELAGFQKYSLDAKTIKRLFLADAEETVNSLLVIPQEMKLLPKNLASKTDHHCSDRAALHRQLYWDALQEEKTLKNRPHKNVLDEWFKTSAVPEEMLDLSPIWDGLMSDEIILKYCKWLMVHPEQYKPRHFVNVGIFEKLEKKMSKTVEDPETDMRGRVTRRLRQAITTPTFNKDQLRVLDRLKATYGEVHIPNDPF